MNFGDAFDDSAKEKLFKKFLSPGDVFLNKFDEIDHSKLFVVVGVDKDKVVTCSVYINSQIHPSLFNKQELLNLQIPLKKSENQFLTHDSFACCSTILPIKTENILDWKENGTCRQELWRWFRLTISGEFGKMDVMRRSDLISFYENLQEVMEAVYLLNEDEINSRK